MPDSRLAKMLAWFNPDAARNGHANGQTKAGAVSGVSLMPGVSFHSPDGTRTIYQILGSTNSEAERVDIATAYQVAAYAYVALRWRAARLAEPPLMVIREDREDGSEDWQPNHPLAQLLENPSPDYDMGELLFRTSLYWDLTGSCLWVVDPNGRGRPGRIVPFSQEQFQIKSDAQRMRASFDVTTDRGMVSVPWDKAVYFHEPDPARWDRGLSRVDVMLGWLNLSQSVRATVRDLLNNSVWPSLILHPDKDWHPTPEQLKQYTDAANSYARPDKRATAMPLLGGGTATIVQTRMTDLIPSDILNRVESVVASVMGVPAVVLQYQVGMENAPWSNMPEARRMAYEDTARAMWTATEKVLTRQLLRVMDPDPSLFVRYDTSLLPALQPDRQVNALIAQAMGRAASLNERRMVMGLEPLDDPKADDIPELTEPSLSSLLAQRPGADPEEPEDDPEDPEEPKGAAGGIERKRDLVAALRAMQIEAAQFDWALTTYQLLEQDHETIMGLWERHAGGKADTPSPTQRKRFLEAVLAYLKGASLSAWRARTRPLMEAHAEQASAAIMADLGIRWDLAKPGIAAFVEKEVGFLIQSISDTTRDAVQRIMTQGLESGASIRDIANNLRADAGFDRKRAILIARTESARVMNGAPVALVQDRQRTTGRKYVKTWSTALDDRVRDEHAAMEGETVAVDANFSNGLAHPSEPNCRCVVTFAEAL